MFNLKNCGVTTQVAAQKIIRRKFTIRYQLMNEKKNGLLDP